MSRRLLVGVFSIGIIGCSSDRPEFPGNKGASSSGDPTGTQLPDGGVTGVSSGSTGSSTLGATANSHSDDTGSVPTTLNTTDTTDPETSSRTSTAGTTGTNTTLGPDETVEPDLSVAPSTVAPSAVAPSAVAPSAVAPSTTDPVPDCDHQCQSGEARCADGQLERCEEDADGCLDWGDATACESAACATATSCVMCDDKCSVGAKSCTDGNLKTCVADELGCLDWSPAEACDTGTCSSATQCLLCDNKCSNDTNSCEDGEVRTCEEDANGCRNWSEPAACDTGACASNSACLVCDDKCTMGTFSCSGTELSACAEDENGCYDYVVEATCGGNTPSCNEDAGRCDCQPAAAPTCTNSTTASECSDGEWVDSPCTGDSPVCVSGLGCQPCTEHSQCPNSACHLAGPKQGTCFATNTVVNVNSPATLLSAVNATTADGESVIKLSVGTYPMSDGLGPLGEVALIGQTGVTIVDNMPYPGDGRGAFITSPGIVYVSKIELQDEESDHTGFTPTTGGVMWLDDVKIRGEGTAVNANGEFHMRRSSVYNCGSGVLAYYNGSIFVENSMIGPPDPASSQTSGIGGISGGVVDVRYSTIVGYHWSVSCTVGSSSGRIANSVIASELNGYSIADDNRDCSEAFTLVTNAVDQTGYGTKIATYSANWFVGASTGNLHLSNAGKIAIPTIAVRASGDPVLDFDGDTRPASAGFPGADQP